MRDLFVAEAVGTYMMNDELVACMRIFAIEDEGNDFFWYPQYCLGHLLEKEIRCLDRINVLVKESRMFCKELKYQFFTHCEGMHW